MSVSSQAVCDEAYQKAMRLCSARECSLHQVLDKCAKSLSVSEQKSLSQRLLKEKWVDEGRFACAFARSASYKGQGPIRIRHELSHIHRLSDLLISQALEASEVDWNSLADQVATKHVEQKLAQANLPLSEQEKWKLRQKCLQFCLRRGFSEGAVSGCIDQALAAIGH